MSNSKKLAPNAKLRIWMRDGFICTYCGKKIKDCDDLSIDHVLPRNHGGSNQSNNLTTSCVRCNYNKGHMLLTQYLRAFEIEVTPLIDKYL